MKRIIILFAIFVVSLSTSIILGNGEDDSPEIRRKKWIIERLNELRKNEFDVEIIPKIRRLNERTVKTSTKTSKKMKNSSSSKKTSSSLKKTTKSGNTKKTVSSSKKTSSSKKSSSKSVKKTTSKKITK